MPMTMRRSLLYAITFCLAMALGHTALGQEPDVRAVYDRLDLLQKDLRDLQQVVFSGAGVGAASAGGAGASAVALAAEVEYRFSTIDDQLRVLMGQIEELGYRLRQTDGRIEKLVAAVDLRLQELEQAFAGASVQPAEGAALSAGGPAYETQPNFGYVPSEDPVNLGAIPGTPGTAPLFEPAAVLPAGTPQEQYDYAFARVKEMQRVAGTENAERMIRVAERVLGEFAEANPEHPKAENAAYWLGEVYYFEGDFERAVVTFARNYQSSPTGGKAADNLLKLGMSYANLDRGAEACTAFRKLEEEFPNASVPVKQTAERQARRAGCP